MRKGFTLIELLLVISIIGILSAMYASVGQTFLVRNYTQNATNDLVSKLRIAQINTLASKRDSRWGVRINGTSMILFAGTTYATRTATYDEITVVPSTVTITPNSGEVVFNKFTGTATPITFTITNNIGETVSIPVNAQGVLDVN